MSSYSSPVPGPWAQPSTAARASSIDASEAGAEWDGRAGHEPEHAPAPAILHQASSARSPITLPHSPTTPPFPLRPPRYPFLGAHAQSLRGGALADMSGRGTGQQRAAESLRQQAAAEEQQLAEQQNQADPAGDQQQPAGAQGADLGGNPTPPARTQQQQRMVPETALNALRFSVNELKAQLAAKDRLQDERGRLQDERDGRTDAELERLSQVRADTRMHDDADLSPLLLGAFLSLDASCAKQVLQHPASAQFSAQ